MPSHHRDSLAPLAGIFLALTCIQTAPAQDFTKGRDFSKVQITTEKVTDGLYVLKGPGANITVSIGDDGVLLIDNQFPGLQAKIRAAVAELSARSIRFALNTNWHYDHADGNEWLAQSGAIVVAHETSRANMLREWRAPEFSATAVFASYRAAALPVVTASDSLIIHFNGDAITGAHIPRAHSDGDLLYRFNKANVLSTGDLFFPKAIPFINFSSGGSLAGMIRAADRILAITDAQTRIIPGHGPVSGRDDVTAARELLMTIHSRLLKEIEAGKTVEEVVAANPLADLYPGRTSYFKVEILTRYGYQDVAREASARR